MNQVTKKKGRKSVPTAGGPPVWRENVIAEKLENNDGDGGSACGSSEISIGEEQ